MSGRYHLKDTDKELSLWKKKQRLRGIYKQWKCGLVQFEDLDVEDQYLLKKYYHVDEP
jgi:hypothetical protein